MNMAFQDKRPKEILRSDITSVKFTEMFNYFRQKQHFEYALNGKRGSDYLSTRRRKEVGTKKPVCLTALQSEGDGLLMQLKLTKK